MLNVNILVKVETLTAERNTVSAEIAPKLRNKEKTDDKRLLPYNLSMLRLNLDAELAEIDAKLTQNLQRLFQISQLTAFLLGLTKDNVEVRRVRVLHASLTEPKAHTGISVKTLVSLTGNAVVR